MSKSFFSLGAAALSLLAAVEASYIQYSTVEGYFLQDENTTVASTFDYTAVNFGLINQTYDTDAAFDPTGIKTQWERFENKVAALKATSPTVDYKVLYIGRHGEGYHNVAQTYYGTPAWNCYWSELDGNGTIVWADAHITPNGAAQAQIANTFWASQITNQKQSVPQTFYTSPLTRCLETAQITWAGLTEKVPTVKELFREGISQHTCDRRSNKTYIEENFPSYTIEAGFTEDDELWRGTTAETSAAQDVRSKKVLDEVFTSDSSTYLSITTHSGEGASLLRVLNHIVFSLATGAVIPVLVQAETLEDAPASSSIVYWSGEATCTVPPITSLATGGCVCPTGTVLSTTTTTSSSPVSVSATATSSIVSATGSTTSGASATESVSSSSVSGIVGSSSTSSTSAIEYTTSTVRTTSVITVTSCAATVTDCPAGPHVTTVTVDLYTTVCPVTATETPAASYSTSTVTSTVYTTSLISSGSEVVTSVIPLYTTTFPITVTSLPAGVSSEASAPYPTAGAGNSTVPAGTASPVIPVPTTEVGGISTPAPSSVVISDASHMGASVALFVGAVFAALWL